MANKLLIKQLEKRRGADKIRIQVLKKTINLYKQGNLPKYTIRIVVHEALKKHFGRGQIDIFLSEKPRRFTKNYTTKNYHDAMALRNIGGVKSLALVRNLIPMPSFTSLQQKFSFMSLLPGYIIEIRIYIKTHLSKLDSWKNGAGKLTGISFDEVHNRKIGMYHAKFDLIVGEFSLTVVDLGFPTRFFQESNFDKWIEM